MKFKCQQTANRGQRSVETLLQIIAKYGHLDQEVAASGHQRAVRLSNKCHGRAEIRCIRDPFNLLQALHPQLRSQLCAAQNALTSKNKIISAFAADFNRLINNHKRCACIAETERERKKGRFYGFPSNKSLLSFILNFRVLSTFQWY